MRCIDRAVRLSPRDIFGEEFQLYYAFAHFQAGRYGEAASAAQIAVRERPGHAVPHLIAVAAYELGGEAEQGRELAERVAILVPDIAVSALEKDFLYCRQEDRTRLAQGLRSAGLPD
jgi:hypothetical protein